MESAHLEVIDTNGRRQVPLDGPLTIGRNFTNLLVLDESLASRFHCVVEKTANGYVVRDLDSRNGTRLNGKPVKSAVMANGDVITIGKTELKLVVPEGAAARVGRAERASSPARAGKQIAQATHDESEALDEFAELAELEPDAFDPQEPVMGEPSEDDGTGSTGDATRILRERADSLPNKSFDDVDIALINARGVTAHAPRAHGKAADKNAGEAVTILRLILLICFRSRATDVHLEPKQDDAQVRVRVDGMMVDVIKVGKEIGVKLASLVKILCDIDISQRNQIQEGHFSSRVPSGKGPASGPRRVDYRVSFAPAMFGQKLVVRVLDTANAPLHITDLDLPESVNQEIRRTIDQSSGMILTCGPTGSGKTTTLYAALRDIDVTQRNVVTIEDPVEIQIEGVTQIPVNDSQGNSFSALLRSVLRQDPDVILVGEVRDADTARVAMQSAMTGHLVFSTVHSRDTVGALYRLLDLGVEPYLVASALQVILAQRLVRELCPHCKQSIKPTPQQLEKMEKWNVTGVQKLFVPKGCRRCLGTGFLGRRGVFELLACTQELREVILKSPSIQDIKNAMQSASYVRLPETGYRLAAAGISSFEEIERAVS